jgi:type I restriction enzyme S subunit
MSRRDKKPIVPKLRFPEFHRTGEWKEYRLDAIAERITEKVGAKSLTTLSITAGVGFVSQAEKFSRDISGKQYENYILLKEGEFSYNKGNSKKFPQGCIYKLKEYKQAAVPNAFISFRINEDYVADFYQGYFDNNFHGKQLLKYITSGARSDGLLNINSTDFFSINLPTPPEKAEQQKIADCLSSLDELITAEAQKFEALKVYQKGLMQKLFPAEGETVPKFRFPEFRDSGEWEERTLEQVAHYENGKAHEQEINEQGKYIVANSKFISTDGEVKKYCDTANLLAKKGDILMVLSDVPNGRAIAKCFYVNKDNTYTVNQRICKLTPKKTVGLVLYYVLNRNTYFLAFDDGVKQTNLKKDDVLNCPILLPKNPKEQQKIAECLSSLDEIIIAQAQKIEALKVHKKGLMQGLFPSADEVAYE